MVIYHVSIVYLTYIYRVSNVIDSGEIADFCCKGTAFPETLQEVRVFVLLAKMYYIDYLLFILKMYSFYFSPCNISYRK